MYVDYEYFSSLYGEQALSEEVFNRFSWEACKVVDHHTAGVDGVKKLKYFFPVDEDDIEAIKRCICELIQTMQKINLAEQNITGYTIREDGSVQGRVVTSVSAGNESISYSVGKTAFDTALNDLALREKFYGDIVRRYLSGVADLNGVNLLYMGKYPKEAI